MEPKSLITVFMIIEVTIFCHGGNHRRETEFLGGRGGSLSFLLGVLLPLFEAARFLIAPKALWVDCMSLEGGVHSRGHGSVFASVRFYR